MKLRIYGFGVVGSSLYKWLKENTKHEINIVDPDKNYFDHAWIANYAFMCVPVPTIDCGHMGWEQNYSILEHCIKQTSESETIFVRSTVLPGTCDKLSKNFNRKIVAMPEFLTERNADQDMKDLNICVGTYDDVISGDLKSIFPGKSIINSTNLEAEMGKFLNNVNGATNVHTSSIFYQLCEKYRCNYEKVLQVGNMPGYLGELYRAQPGPDGQLGYGGKCFDKDMKAFATFSCYDSINKIIEENEVIRNE